MVFIIILVLGFVATVFVLLEIYSCLDKFLPKMYLGIEKQIVILRHIDEYVNNRY